MPVISFHGSADRSAPYAGGQAGGHTWPGAAERVWIPPIFGKVATIDASRLIWDFLSAHRRG